MRYKWKQCGPVRPPVRYSTVRTAPEQSKPLTRIDRWPCSRPLSTRPAKTVHRQDKSGAKAVLALVVRQQNANLSLKGYLDTYAALQDATVPTPAHTVCREGTYQGGGYRGLKAANIGMRCTHAWIGDACGRSGFTVQGAGCRVQGAGCSASSAASL